MKILIIYHHACADGAFAAAITALAHKDAACHFFASNYTPNDGDIVDADGKLLDERQDILQRNFTTVETVKDHEGNDAEIEVKHEVEYHKVVVVDFSLSERQMAVFTQRFGSNFIVLDHHNVRTRERYVAECQKLDTPPAPEMIFNASGSGALLAYMKNLTRFNDTSHMRYLGNLIRIAQMVSDRDTWQRHITKAFEFYEGYAPELFADKEPGGVLFEQAPNTVSRAIEIIKHGDIEEIRALGRQRIVERNAKIERMIDQNSLFSNGNSRINFNHVVLPAGRAIGSEAAQFVFDTYPFYLVIMPRISDKHPDTVFISCRSIGQDETSPHSAKQVAMMFGGNGHANAAGWQMDRAAFESMYPEVKLGHEEQDVVCC